MDADVYKQQVAANFLNFYCLISRVFKKKRSTNIFLAY